MSLQHTPGPWMHLTGDRGIYTVLHDGCRGLPVAHVYTPDKIEDARLIAAAPELADSCDEDGLTGDEAIADTLEQLAEQYGRNGLALLAQDLRTRTRARRAAIAKATQP